jgi:hypothetical protein
LDAAPYPKLLLPVKNNQQWLSLIFTESLKREAWVGVTTFSVCFSFRKASPFLQDTKILHDEIDLQHDFKSNIHREERKQFQSHSTETRLSLTPHFSIHQHPKINTSLILNPTLKPLPRTPKWHQTTTTSSSSSSSNKLPQATPTSKHLNTLARHNKATKARARRNTPTSKIEDLADIINNSHIMDLDNPLPRWL